MSISTISCCVALFAICIWLKHRRTSGVVPLPPGPPADPLIGHLRKLPLENKELIFYEWGRQYGDVVYLNILGRPMIVLNSLQAAVDLLEKRSLIYSDRPKFVTEELLGWQPSLVMLPYGQRFRKHRKMLHSGLTEHACLAFRPVQIQNAHILLRGLVENQGDYNTHLNRFSTSVIMRFAYGHQILSDDDKYMKLIDDVITTSAAAGVPGTTPVDLFPWLQHFPPWFPGTHYAYFARSSRLIIRRLFDVPYENVKKQMADGTYEPSFLTLLLEEPSNQEMSEEDVDDIKGATGMLYGAGADTTLSSLSTFLLTMVLYPECQQKAWEEINSVTKGERLPDFADKSMLPYMECVVQEVLRWHPIAPLGVPHRSTGDDIYRGMFIPKGSIVFANAFAMSRDENTYANPTLFNPSRFLPESKGGNGEPFLEAAFGFGRRWICPGRHFAKASLWIAIASILATLEISAPRNEHGQEIFPKIDFITTSAVSRPKPFACNFRTRNKTAEQLILQASQSLF